MGKCHHKLKRNRFFSKILETSNGPVYITLDVKPNGESPEFLTSNIERLITNNFLPLNVWPPNVPLADRKPRQNNKKPLR